MEKSEILYNLLKDVIKRKIKIRDFIKKFSEYYIDNEKEINRELDNETFEIISELHTNFDYYSENGITYDTQLNDDELMDQIKKTYNRIKPHFS